MSSIIVETKYGKVRGMQTGTVSVWRGIPYAKPPVGTLRFRPPQSPESWSGIRDATHFSPGAPQPRSRIKGDPFPTNEDCLYLNIWSPKADEKRRPVMVWIHGGFFMNGTGSDPRFDGTSFAKNGDVVLVTINYRLGSLGFLALGEIDNDAYSASANCGLLDQVAAFQWIQENIAAFGGDPNRVTIFGQSAGARSVAALLSMPSAKGLFHQAIIHSGGLRSYGKVQSKTALTKKILESLNIGTHELSELEKIPFERILDVTPGPQARNGLEPSIDGTYFPEYPLEAIKAGKASDVPIMIGTNLNEFPPSFDPNWTILDDHELLMYFEKEVGAVWSEVLPYYLENSGANQSLLEKLIPLQIYQIFAYPAILLGEMKANQETPAWIYRFDWRSPVLGNLAVHGLEIPFVFQTHENPMIRERYTGDSPELLNLAEQMHLAWIAFAHNGNPNTPEISNWPAYDLESRATMVFNSETRVALDLNSEERQVWEQAEKRKMKI